MEHLQIFAVASLFAVFVLMLALWRASVKSRQKDIQDALSDVLNVALPFRYSLASKWRALAMDDQSRPALLMRQDIAAYIAALDVSSHDWSNFEASDTLQKMEWAALKSIAAWIDFHQSGGAYPAKTHQWKNDFALDLDQLNRIRRTSNVWACSYNILLTSWWGRLWFCDKPLATTWMDEKEHRENVKNLNKKLNVALDKHAT